MPETTWLIIFDGDGEREELKMNTAPGYRILWRGVQWIRRFVNPALRVATYYPAQG